VLKPRVFVIFGTRPEVIKMAPVIRALRNRSERCECIVVSSGQHREMVDQALGAFDLQADIRFDAMASAKSLGALTSRLLSDFDGLLDAERPDWVLVQGDTTTAMVGAMSAFYRRIRIGHVEAGLRTYNRWSPFPEEVNRSIIGQVADLHFAPTTRSERNLLSAGIPQTSIRIAGNTVVDSLMWVNARLGDSVPIELVEENIPGFIQGRQLVLVTSHRRESFGEGMRNICSAIRQIVNDFPNSVVVFPVHLNPNVQRPVRETLGDHDRIQLLQPVGYEALIWLMRESYCILTDSGGIQEEAPSFGKPLLIMRDTTERPEVVEAGCAKLVGTDFAGIVAAARELFTNKDSYRTMSAVANPFGNGFASEAIADSVLTFNTSNS
jgi:UDP-N-acetylglucosamine 2-epimerase (non-hydrolysing)